MDSLHWVRETIDPDPEKSAKIIKENWLAFAIFTVDKNHELEKFVGVANDIIRNQIYYDYKINPERIFYINEDLRSEDKAFWDW